MTILDESKTQWRRQTICIYYKTLPPRNQLDSLYVAAVIRNIACCVGCAHCVESRLPCNCQEHLMGLIKLFLRYTTIRWQATIAYGHQGSICHTDMVSSCLPMGVIAMRIGLKSNHRPKASLPFNCKVCFSFFLLLTSGFIPVLYTSIPYFPFILTFQIVSHVLLIDLCFQFLHSPSIWGTM